MAVSFLGTYTHNTEKTRSTALKIDLNLHTYEKKSRAKKVWKRKVASNKWCCAAVYMFVMWIRVVLEISSQIAERLSNAYGRSKPNICSKREERIAVAHLPHAFLIALQDHSSFLCLSCPLFHSILVRWHVLHRTATGSFSAFYVVASIDDLLFVCIWACV